MMFKNFGLVLLGFVDIARSSRLGAGAGKVLAPSETKSESPQVVEFHQIDLMSQLPDTAPLAQFLQRTNSSLFPNSEMGNILVYFDETVRELLLFKASISDTVAQMSRSNAFLSTLKPRIEKIIKMCQGAKEDKTIAEALHQVENLIAAFVFLDNHRVEIWANGVNSGSPSDGSLPPVIYLFRDMLNLPTKEPSLEKYKGEHDWIAQCEAEAVLVAGAQVTGAKKSIFSFGKGKDAKDVIGVSTIRDVFPNLRALEAIWAFESKDGITISDFNVIVQSLKTNSLAYCAKQEERRTKGTGQEPSPAEAVDEKKHGLTVQNAIKFVDTMGRFSAKDLFKPDIRNYIADWLKTGAETATSITISLR